MKPCEADAPSPPLLTLPVRPPRAARERRRPAARGASQAKPPQRCRWPCPALPCAPVGVRADHHKPVACLVARAHGKGHQRGGVASEEVAAARRHALPPLPLRQLHKAGLQAGGSRGWFQQGWRTSAARPRLAQRLNCCRAVLGAVGCAGVQAPQQAPTLSRRCRASSTAWYSVGEAFRYSSRSPATLSSAADGGPLAAAVKSGQGRGG